MKTTHTRSKIVDCAVSHLSALSTPYTTPDNGISPESGFDCSGFICFVLDYLKIPRSLEIRHASELFDSFGIPIHPEARGAGDLVFFSKDGYRPTHVGILFTNIDFIHSPGTPGSKVCISSLPECKIFHHTSQRLEGQLYFHNPIGFKRVAIKNGRYQSQLPLD
ncbi:MAG: C40 family peptidase [bacterium]|nr:C40 family peptidase [bacterium]